MVAGWRRAFCSTSIQRDTESKALTEKQQQHRDWTKQSPKISFKLKIFSNPSTPQSPSQPVSSPTLRFRTSVATGAPSSSVPNSPKLQCSNVKTPKSPSRLSLLKASLCLSKSRCGICMQSVKTGQGTGIFTAECSHDFHFPCIANHATKQKILMCPVCSTNWKELPVLALHNEKNPSKVALGNRAQNLRTRSVKLYNDDEPLMSPTSVAHFNPIPESDENEEDREEEEETTEFQFQGFNVKPVGPLSSSSRKIRNIEVCLLPEAAIVAARRSHKTCVVVLRVKAPPSHEVARRPPIDLVTVLDVGGTMTGPKLQILKRSMRTVISTLGPTDRLSIVAFSQFSAGSKRLIPLRRMNGQGQRSARRIVDALAAIDQTREGDSVKNDAVKKAAKVLEDRREKNPVASIILFSDGHDDRVTVASFNPKRSSFVSSTRFTNQEIPVHSVKLPDSGACDNEHRDNAFAKCVGSLLNVVAQDLRLQLRVVSHSVPVEISAVYSLSGQPSTVGSGSAVLGDLYAEEQRELLVELKVPNASTEPHHFLSVRSSHRDPTTQQLVNSTEYQVLIPRTHTVRSSDPKIERLLSLHVTARAVTESRRLLEHNDLSGAHHLLSSARALLMQSRPKTANEHLSWLEAEQAELQHRGLQQLQHIAHNCMEGTVEPLTPSSAWSVAERLAKIAVMRRSMNRVSDLHGLENARF